MVFDVNVAKTFENLDSWRDEFLIQVRELYYHLHRISRRGVGGVVVVVAVVVVLVVVVVVVVVEVVVVHLGVVTNGS